jgi:hypothetical protein
VMVPSVEKGDGHRRIAEAARGVEAGEAPAEDHHVGKLIHRPIVSRRQRAKRTTSSSGGTAFSSA